MSNQWNDDQASGERAMRKWAKEREAAEKLIGSLRTSGITADDCRSVEMQYSLAGQAGSHRIVDAMRYLRAWLEGGA